MARTKHPRKLRRAAERFDSWEEAFNACRERNRPIKVVVGTEMRTIFPSGHAKGT